MKSSPEYNYLQYAVACAMKWYTMYIICIEINKHRMITYNKIGRDNIRKKRICSMGFRNKLSNLYKYVSLIKYW
jgi:hypothetical protein